MQVFKFGGASVKDAAAVKNVSEILKKFASRPTTVVISAMGKTTNSLEQLVSAYFYKKEDPEKVLQQVKEYHQQILSELFPDKKHPVYAEIENTFVELNWIIEDEPAFGYNHEYDQIVCMGEIIATKIVSAYLTEAGLKNKWMDARGLIQTDNTYREGKVNYEHSTDLVSTQLLPQFKDCNIVVTQGFIGGTSENFTTTLGREGSDYTAALLAYFTNAESVTIWKDVPGVLNADPKYFKNTKKIDELTYHDAIELTYYGASVIHPKTIKPLQNKNIPLYVRSFVKPDDEGTVIRESDKRLSVPGYIFKVDQILISIQPKDFSFIAEDNLSLIFKLFSRYGVKVNVMQNSAISFSVCTDNDEQKIDPLIKALQEQFKVLYNSGLELLTIRNYDHKTIEKLTENKTVILEQRSRNTIQMVMSEIL
jgi:aspartate kinase